MGLADFPNSQPAPEGTLAHVIRYHNKPHPTSSTSQTSTLIHLSNFDSHPPLKLRLDIFPYQCELAWPRYPVSITFLCQRIGSHPLFILGSSMISERRVQSALLYRVRLWKLPASQPTSYSRTTFPLNLTHIPRSPDTSYRRSPSLLNPTRVPKSQPTNYRRTLYQMLPSSLGFCIQFISLRSFSK